MNHVVQRFREWRWVYWSEVQIVALINLLWFYWRCDLSLSLCLTMCEMRIGDRTRWCQRFPWLWFHESQIYLRSPQIYSMPGLEFRAHLSGYFYDPCFLDSMFAFLNLALFNLLLPTSWQVPSCQGICLRQFVCVCARAHGRVCTHAHIHIYVFGVRVKRTEFWKTQLILWNVGKMMHTCGECQL